MNLTAGQIAEIEAKVAANCQPVRVTVAGAGYDVPYRIAQDIRAGRRTTNYISPGRGRKAVSQSRAALAAALNVDLLTARLIASQVR
jgi:hypothetical protein